MTPAPASALITGKAFAAGARSVAQVVWVMALAYLMNAGLTPNPLRILPAMAIVMLGAAFFASNALYPVDVMPAWLRLPSKVNPPSYEVDRLRGLLIGTPFNPVDADRNRHGVNTVAPPRHLGPAGPGRIRQPIVT